MNALRARPRCAADRRCGDPRPSARAFALPIVLILALLVGIVTAVVLDRQANQRQTVERELREYQSQHFERGIREVVGAWTDTLAGQPIDKMLDVDGHALDLVIPDGSYAAVYMFDGQGSVVTEPAGLTDDEQTDAAGILQQLQAMVGNNVDPSWLRPVGPPKISLASAPPEIVMAVAQYADPKNGKRLGQTLLRARDKGELTQSDIESAISSAGLTDEPVQVARRLLLPKPDLWVMVVDVYDPARPPKGGGPSVRYGARFLMPGVGAARTSSLQSLGKFLSWEEVPVNE